MSWVLVSVVVAATAVAAWFTRRYVALRGARLVECPETHEQAAVDIQTARAALGQGIDLSGCSRWPERHACGRECLAQIGRSPSGCLVRTIVTRWYDGKVCAVCHEPLGEIDWLDRTPGLIDSSGTPRPWPDIAPEHLPQAMASDQPICFDCYVAAAFRRQHPELVLDNPWKRE
jgi:hypothetical protein